jgi:hypothetical protein
VRRLLCVLADNARRVVVDGGCETSGTGGGRRRLHIIPRGRPERFWIEGLRHTHAASDYQNARPSQRESMLGQLRGRLAEKWREAMEHAGTEPQLRVSPETLQ